MLKWQRWLRLVTERLEQLFMWLVFVKMGLQRNLNHVKNAKGFFSVAK
jgi:hypothetical protein